MRQSLGSVYNWLFCCKKRSLAKNRLFSYPIPQSIGFENNLFLSQSPLFSRRKTNCKQTLGIVLLSCALSTSILAADRQNEKRLTPAESKKEFIQELVTKHHFNRFQLTHLIRSLHENYDIIARMTHPYEKKPWSFYRHFFITPERITLGAVYLKTHHALLEKLQQTYGIPASVMVAIIGIETEYGRHLGKYSVLDSLYTLGFYYPPREHFFRKELAQYLILTRDDHLPVTKVKGSYAGALGIPQFMPSSYRHYAVSASDNRRVNLFNNNDAIASVANYFYKMGWQPNQPIARHLYSTHARLNSTYETRIDLPLESGDDYWATYRNFKVIMSYNHNVVYAMAVYQLSNAIEKQYEMDMKRA